MFKNVQLSLYMTKACLLAYCLLLSPFTKSRFYSHPEQKITKRHESSPVLLFDVCRTDRLRRSRVVTPLRPAHHWRGLRKPGPFTYTSTLSSRARTHTLFHAHNCIYYKRAASGSGKVAFLGPVNDVHTNDDLLTHPRDRSTTSLLIYIEAIQTCNP